MSGLNITVYLLLWPISQRYNEPMYNSRIGLLKKKLKCQLNLFIF